MVESIISQRLELRPMTPAFLQASLDHNLLLAEKILGASLPASWPENSNLLSLRLEQLKDDPSLQPWLLRAICLREESSMVGQIGFHTSPAPEYLEEWLAGALEFGFTVFSDHRQKGYATEAAGALMQWAYQTHAVDKFVLTIAPDNTPSRRLADRFGFARIGSHVDEVDGLEDIFALHFNA